MIRVMLLATDLQKGGLPLRLTRIAPRLRELGVQPIVGCLACRGPLADELEAQGVESFSCDAVHRLDVGCLARLARWIRRFNPDVVHGFLFHANLAVRLVGRLDRSRPIITSTVTIEIERTWHRWIESVTGGLSDLHMVNARAVADHVCEDLAFAPEKVVVIPNAVDLKTIELTPPIERRSFGLSDDVPLVVWAGRMDPIKDLPTFVEVVNRLRTHRPIKAVLLGDGPRRAATQRLIDRRGLHNVIRIFGWTDDVFAWLKTANVLLFPSRTEGAPNVVLEAIACNCPVVASDIPSCREFVRSSTLGRLCPAGDIGQMAAAVSEVLDQRLAERPEWLAQRYLLMRSHDMPQVLTLWGRMYDLAMQFL